MKTGGNAIFLRILVPAVTGTWLGLYFRDNSVIGDAAGCLCLALFSALLFVHFRYQKYKLYLRRWIPGLLTTLFCINVFFCIAVVRFTMNRADHFSHHKMEALLVEVASEPKVTEKSFTMEAVVEQGLRGCQFTPLSGELLVTVMKDSSVLGMKQGDLLLVPSDFRIIEPPLNPYEFDYRQYLANRGIYDRLFCPGSCVKKITGTKHARLQILAADLRERIAGRFHKYIKDKDAAAVASTLILGEKASLSPAVLSSYSNTGVMHVLSVSGMHVALVMILLTYLLWFMNYAGWRRICQSLIIILAIWLYAVLSGLSAAVCRASLMITMMIIAGMLRRDHDISNSVSASAVILLVYNPSFLQDIGFQLSYLAVFGLIYIYPVIYKILKVKNKLLDKVWACISVSLAAQLATFPLCLYYFNQFPVYFLLANIFISIPTACIMYTGIVFMLVPLHPVSYVLGFLLKLCISFMNEGLRYIEALPHSVVQGTRFGFWYYVLMYGAILFFFFSIRKRNRGVLYMALLLVFLLSATASSEAIRMSTRKSILFYSLRKGFAIGFFNGRYSYVAGRDITHKTLSYSILPAIQSRGLSLNAFFDMHKKVVVPSLYSDGHFLQFSGQRLLVWNRDFKYKQYSSPISVDYFILSGNPPVQLMAVRQFVRFKVLLIAADNAEYRVKKWEQEAGRLKISYHSLKNSGSYEVNCE